MRHKNLPSKFKAEILLRFQRKNRICFGALNNKYTEPKRTTAFEEILKYCKDNNLEQYGISSIKDLKLRFKQWKYDFLRKFKPFEKSGAGGPKTKSKSTCDSIMDNVVHQNPAAHLKRKVCTIENILANDIRGRG